MLLPLNPPYTYPVRPVSAKPSFVGSAARPVPAKPSFRRERGMSRSGEAIFSSGETFVLPMLPPSIRRTHFPHSTADWRCTTTAPMEISGTSNTDFAGTDVSPYGYLRDGMAAVP